MKSEVFRAFRDPPSKVREYPVSPGRLDRAVPPLGPRVYGNIALRVSDLRRELAPLGIFDLRTDHFPL